MQPSVPTVPRAADVLYEDNHLLAINKPAGLPTMGVSAGETSLVTWARDYIKHKYNKPGNVYIGVVSRLDSLVSGVVVLARTSKAASRLTAQFHDRQTEKLYWAWVAPGLQPDKDQWTDWMRKDERRRCMVVCTPEQREAKEAKLSYTVLRREGRGVMLEVRLETGRKHQIRVQCAHHGYPILGDTKYGSSHPFPHGIALHARYLTIEHPTQKTPVHLAAPLPTYW
jgi:23S rRNA pseudouridine1911/1915/1917 synthase